MRNEHKKPGVKRIFFTYLAFALALFVIAPWFIAIVMAMIYIFTGRLVLPFGLDIARLLVWILTGLLLDRILRWISD